MTIIEGISLALKYNRIGVIVIVIKNTQFKLRILYNSLLNFFLNLNRAL